MTKSSSFEFPKNVADERELLLTWLGYLRGAVLRNLEGLDDAAARWRPDERLLPLAGIANHLVGVERRWIDGGMLGGPIYRGEEEFFPGGDLPIESIVTAYRDRAVATDHIVRSLPLDAPCGRGEGTDLRWVLLHLVQETARHAGHADAVRELLDGSTGE